MATLPPVRRVTKEDLKGAPDWVTQLLGPLNSFMEATYSALDNNLTVGDNISAGIVTVKVRTKSSYGVEPWFANKTYVENDVVSYSAAVYKCTTANSDATWTAGKWTEITTATGTSKTDNWEIVNVNNPLKIRPKCVLIGQISETENYSVVTNPTSLHWDYLNGTIRIKYIAGLAASKKYEINLLVF